MTIHSTDDPDAVAPDICFAAERTSPWLDGSGDLRPIGLGNGRALVNPRHPGGGRPKGGPVRISVSPPRTATGDEKGPRRLAASGPSLGRKRPRRAAPEGATLIWATRPSACTRASAWLDPTSDAVGGFPAPEATFYRLRVMASQCGDGGLVGLRSAIRVQLTNHGHRAHLEAVEGAFGCDMDFALLVKG